MTGADFTQEEIDTYTGIILEAKKTNKAVPKTFRLHGTKCEKFRVKEYDVDPATGRLYQGTCQEEKSIDHGKKRFTLAKTNLADQNFAREYLLREFAHQPQLLQELQNCNRGSIYGRKKFLKALHGLLNARFDVAAAKFITDGAKNEWNLQHLCTHAQAYVEIFKGMCLFGLGNFHLYVPISHSF